MVWRPSKTVGLLTGLIFILTIGGINVYLIGTLLGQSIDVNLFITALLLVISMPLFFLWCYWYAGLIALRYYLDRNGLVISSVGYRYTIPMHTIRGILLGANVTMERGFRGVGWPGYLKGHMQLADLGLLWVHSTEPLSKQVIIVTDTVCHGISPRSPMAFVEDYVRRRALKPMRELPNEQVRLDLAALPIWHDRVYWVGMGLALLADVALFGWVAARFSALPSFIPLHVSTTGEVVRIAAKISVFMLPVIGVLTTTVNGLAGLLFHKRERLGTYMLLGSMLLVHVALWLAAIGMIGK